MAQPKSSDKSGVKPEAPNKPQSPNNNNKDNPKTFGKEPPMIDPNTPDHPNDYEVEASDEKPLLH